MYESEMKHETTKVVGVWYDATPEPEYRAWVVADEELFADGSTANTYTIAAFGDDRDAAIAAGELRAKQRGVALAIQEHITTHGVQEDAAAE